MTGADDDISAHADRLTEALDMAEDVFVRTFQVAGAESAVVMQSGALLSFRKSGNPARWGLFVVGESTNPLRNSAMRSRAEAATLLGQLWVSCAAARRDRVLQMETAVDIVLDFVREVTSPKEEPR